MSFRTSTIVLALATLAAPAAFAESVFVGGEQGWIDQPVQSRLTRGQVTSEYLAFRNNPVAPDGGQFVGGEMGYAFPAHTYARAPAPQELSSPAKAHAQCADRIRRTLHDHGIERGYGPAPVLQACISTTLAKAGNRPTADAPAPALRHDHGRFHKNQ